MSSLGARHGHSDGLSLDDADMCRAGTAAHLAAALPRVTYAAGHAASCWYGSAPTNIFLNGIIPEGVSRSQNLANLVRADWTRDLDHE